ncbi:MAG: GLPGLI family protein [Bacteroidota bacterium]
MQRIITFLLISLPIFVFAQQSSGEITYAETIRFGDKLKIKNPELAELLPESQTSKKQLLFTPYATLYQDHPTDNEPQEFSGESEGMSIKMTISRSQDALYHDLSENTFLERKDFMGKTFLIEVEDPKTYEWKILGEQANIAGQLCIKAVYAQGDSTEEVFAWFAPQLPIQAGPQRYHQLPGLILKLEMDRGTRSIVAEEINFRSVSPEEMPKPEEGKRVSQKKYDQIVKEKTKEMEMEYGKSSGGTSIIIRN